MEILSSKCQGSSRALNKRLLFRHAYTFHTKASFFKGKWGEKHFLPCAINLTLTSYHITTLEEIEASKKSVVLLSYTLTA